MSDSDVSIVIAMKAQKTANQNTVKLEKERILKPYSRLPLSSLMSNPPTVVLGAANADSTITNGKLHLAILENTTTVNPLFTYYGGIMAQSAASSAFVKNNLVTPTSTTTGNVEVEFNYFGQEFELYERGITGAKLQVLIDEGSGWGSVFTSPVSLTSGGANYYRKFTFTDKKLRRVKVQYSGTYFGGVVIGLYDDIYRATPFNKVKAVFFGDSNIEGTGADNPYYGFSPLTAEMLGYDCYISGSGGTGYVNPGVVTGRVKYIDRVQHDCIDINPDIVIVAGGNNDTTMNITDVQNNSLAFYQKLKTDLPNAKIIIQGNMAKQSPATAAQLAVRDALKASALSVGLPFIDTIDGITYNEKGEALNSATGSWFTGTGSDVAPGNRGNASSYLTSDFTHCNNFGYRYLAERMMREIMKIVM